MSRQSCILLSILLTASFTSSAPLDTRRDQQPLPATYHSPDPADANTFATLNYHAPAENPRNKTCSAADTACVMGVSTSKRSEDSTSDETEDEISKRSGGIIDAEQNAGVSTLTNANSNIIPKPNVTETNNTSSSGSHDGMCSAADTACVVGKRAGGVQEASEQAGVTRLTNSNQAVIKQNSTSTSGTSSSSSGGSSGSGMCSAADTACVVGVHKRAAEDLDERIQQLRVELEQLKEKRQTGSLAVPGIKPLPNTSNGASSTTNQGSSATNSTTEARATQTNAFGRKVCHADDVECVTGN